MDEHGTRGGTCSSWLHDTNLANQANQMFIYVLTLVTNTIHKRTSDADLRSLVTDSLKFLGRRSTLSETTRVKRSSSDSGSSISCWSWGWRWMKPPSSAAEAAGFGTVMFQKSLVSHAWTCAKQLSDRFLKDTFLVIFGRLGAAGAGFESSRRIASKIAVFDQPALSLGQGSHLLTRGFEPMAADKVSNASMNQECSSHKQLAANNDRSACSPWTGLLLWFLRLGSLRHRLEMGASLPTNTGHHSGGSEDIFVLGARRCSASHLEIRTCSYLANTDGIPLPMIDTAC